MKKINRSFIIIGFFICLSLFLSFYKIEQVPPCINADEAAFGYNAYSLLKTGKDEYGAFMPARLVSFRDFKLPLYSYLSMPIIAIFGYNDFSTKALNIIVAALYVPLMYIIARQLFQEKKIGYIAALLTSVSPWIYILTRHAHEGPLSSFFILVAFYFLILFSKKHKLGDFIFACLGILLASFSYHSARLFIVAFIVYAVYLLLTNKSNVRLKKRIFYGVTLLFIFLVPFLVDIKYSVNRVANLFFLKNIGFTLTLNEYIGEHPNRIIHNKLTEGVRDVTNRYFSQLSPEYLISRGDTNWRFGFKNLGLITPLEYILIFIGLYYLFLNKNKYRFVVLLLMLISPIPNALTWQDASIIRTYTMIFPLILIVSFGAYYFFVDLLRQLGRLSGPIALFSILVLFGFYFYNNWDIYFNHYPKRAVVVRAWQCGYKELVQYVQSNYQQFDSFRITDRHGQPYIYFLHYMQYDPGKYQTQAKISAPDKYGFGQIDSFDKFSFKFHFDGKAKKTMFVGYPDEFKDLPINMNKIKKITIGTEEIFWIYET